MTRWLMAHVGCWPRRTCAAGHHVCLRACSNTDFLHTKPYLTADLHHTHVKCCGEAPGALSAKTLAVGAQAAPTSRLPLCLQQH